MYAWRNLKGQSIVAAFIKLRAQQFAETKQKAPKKRIRGKATPTKLHSV